MKTPNRKISRKAAKSQREDGIRNSRKRHKKRKKEEKKISRKAAKGPRMDANKTYAEPQEEALIAAKERKERKDKRTADAPAVVPWSPDYGGQAADLRR
jgi:hypothetical protein